MAWLLRVPYPTCISCSNCYGFYVTEHVKVQNIPWKTGLWDSVFGNRLDFLGEASGEVVFGRQGPCPVRWHPGSRGTRLRLRRHLPEPGCGHGAAHLSLPMPVPSSLCAELMLTDSVVGALPDPLRRPWQAFRCRRWNSGLPSASSEPSKTPERDVSLGNPVSRSRKRRAGRVIEMR